VHDVRNAVRVEGRAAPPSLEILMGVDEHRRAGRRHEAACAILTVSDTRTKETDASGALVGERLREAGHRVHAYEILPDEPARVAGRMREMIADPDVDAVIATGGTGIARRDSTVEAVSGLLEKRLDGFGELFRMLSYQEIGAAAMLSRAVAGVARGTFVVLLPGSRAAVDLALTKLVVPELGHVVGLLRE